MPYGNRPNCHSLPRMPLGLEVPNHTRLVSASGPGCEASPILSLPNMNCRPSPDPIKIIESRIHNLNRTDPPRTVQGIDRTTADDNLMCWGHLRMKSIPLQTIHTRSIVVPVGGCSANEVCVFDEVSALDPCLGLFASGSPSPDSSATSSIEWFCRTSSRSSLNWMLSWMNAPSSRSRCCPGSMLLPLMWAIQSWISQKAFIPWRRTKFRSSKSLSAHNVM